MAKNNSNRLASCKILTDILQHKGSLASALGSTIAASPQLNPALIQELCFGVCRWFYPLEFIASSYLSKPLRKKDSDIYCLILIGLYQLLYMRTPAHAAINETVADVPRLGKPWAKGLVNAVLREAQRGHDSLLPQIESDYCTKYSHPQWLIDKLKQDWPKHFRSILDENNNRGPMTLRVNTQLISRDDYAATLEQHGISARFGDLSDTALTLDCPHNVVDLPGFSLGQASVQDEASQLIAAILPLEPGLRVLDACSAPGGKTCAILEKEAQLKELVSLDIDERRLGRVKENLERCGLVATTQVGDISNPASWWDGSPFDRIVLDVPCSAIGVIRRNPDIKLLRRESDIARLCEQQAAILIQAWQMLNKGGFLLYSTCSTLLDENSHQIAAFINSTADAISLPIDHYTGIPCEFGLQLLPQLGKHDGFYYALLQKC